MNDKQQESLTYRASGVDIAAGNRLVDRIRPIVANTRIPGVLDGIGGFGSLFELPVDRYKQPVLVSGTDGVGTKLKLAFDLGIHDSVGIDLVAMCVNDILVLGAEPLYFLDYFATGGLDVDVAAKVIEGIGKGCELAGAALVGGETAEMPGMYAQGEYDLAGFCVGVVEKEKIIDGRRIKPGDRLLGISSSGPHANGYSLIRKILGREKSNLDEVLVDRTLGQHLLEPTRIYAGLVKELLAEIEVKGIAHITGGGITENLPRILPDFRSARIDLGSWDIPPVFEWIQSRGNVELPEMLTTFNCGIGMVLCVDPDDELRAVEFLTAVGETCYRIGSIIDSKEKTARVSFQD